MVFGNMGDTSATGVAFTRNPSTGANELYGEFLINAQGEDVVAGIRTPQNITEAARIAAHSDKPSMETALPACYAEFVRVSQLLEKHYRDMQDMEFTVERGKLWMLQTRNGKRTAKAALRIAVEMASEGLLTQEEAVLRVDPAALDQLLHPTTIDPKAERKVVATGLPASPGARRARVKSCSTRKMRRARKPLAAALFSCASRRARKHSRHARGGRHSHHARRHDVSHAAVVARGMGKPCVSGAGQIRIDYVTGVMTAMGRQFRKGDVITIDGSTGTGA